MADKKPIRAWLYLEPEEVQKHVMFIEDAYGMCGNCKKLGLNFVKDKQCPECKTTFRYASTKLKRLAEVAKIASRIQREGLALQLIDRDDFDRASAKDKISELFNK